MTHKTVPRQGAIVAAVVAVCVVATASSTRRGTLFDAVRTHLSGTGVQTPVTAQRERLNQLLARS